MIRAKDVMTTDVVAAAPNMTLKELAALFVSHHISGAPVVNAAGFLIGVISASDIARRESQMKAEDRMPWFYLHPESSEHTLALEAPETVRVRDYMTPIVIQAGREDDIVEVAKRMLGKKIHRIIIAEDERLYGIVSTMDVMRALVREVESRARTQGRRLRAVRKGSSKSRSVKKRAVTVK